MTEISSRREGSNLPPGLAAILPENEAARMDALARYDILDSASDERFDRIARLASLSLRVPIAFVTFVDSERVWFKSTIGVELDECSREGSFCGNAILQDGPMIVPNTTEDPRFRDNPFVVGDAGIRFYAGAPLRTADGFNLGTICVFDVEPREMFDREKQIITDLSALVVEELELRIDTKAALEATAGRLRDVAANVPGVAYQFRIDASGQRSFPYVSPTLKQIFGLDVQAVMSDHSLWFDRMHADELTNLESTIESSHRTMEPWAWEGRAYADHGELRWFRGSATPRAIEDGAVLWTGLLLDVNDEIEAEQRLKQAQKLEAVGQLTGGVAHDFNNLLAVIQGNADLLGRKIGHGSHLLQAILRSTRRGAELTQQLLAFSRRQALRPTAFDLGAMVAEMLDMLQRTLGETIAVSIERSGDLWPALADPGQVENALLNLAINARDAMAGGGSLHISCSNARLAEQDLSLDGRAKPGQFVLLSVADDGKGMSPGVLDQALEPFFSTKEVGQGSGLGLSMIYGFAEQSGGHLSIESQEGKGTTVRLYLPRAPSEVEMERDPVREEEPIGRGQRVLLIEDNSDMRIVTAQVLIDLGYRVDDVSDALDARQKIASGIRFDLVLSDVVLPGGVSGPEFAVELEQSHPGLPVLFMSGYPADVVNRQSGFKPDDRILRKPFERAVLATVLRDKLKA